MSFAVAAEAYDSFMGRYSRRLAPPFLAFTRAERAPVLDVGCGPGALTSVLVEQFGAEGVAAADPSEPLVEAARQRHPGVRVELAPAEDLPFADGSFVASLAQLVVHFMADPVAGLREMARVTEAGGVVAACVWDLTSTRSPLGPFWEAARAVDSEVVDESGLAGAREGELAELFAAAGLAEVEDDALSIDVEHASFDEYWGPFSLGVGPAGAYLASVDEQARVAIEDRCRSALPDGSFTLEFRAWAARGVSP